MSIRLRFLVLIIALLTAGPFPGFPTPTAPAQDDPASNQSEPELADAPSAADQALQPLLKKFRALHSALQARGGFAEEDRPVLDRLLQQVRQHNDQYPDHPAGLAMELQLRLWLDQTEPVDELFERLYETTGSLQVGQQWATYHERQKNQQRAREIYQRLLNDFPDNVDLRVEMAESEKNRNRFAQAIDILDDVEIDFAAKPRTAVLLSDCYFAEHQFSKALEVLNQIPDDVLSSNQPLKRQVEQKRTQVEEYINLWEQEQALREAEAEADDLPRVKLITTKGPITVELFENQAPNTVANFISLVEDGFYDGTKFHRVLENFMAQGGDPNTKPGNEGPAGQGDPGYKIPDEHDREDARMHFSGSLAMAKPPGGPDSAGSQFYLTHLPTPWLNGQYTVFGRVIEGLDIVRQIEKDDEVVTATVLRKRDHEYIPETISKSATQPPTPPATPPGG